MAKKKASSKPSKGTKKDGAYYVNKDQDVIQSWDIGDGQRAEGRFKADFASRSPTEGANTYVAAGTKEGQRPERDARRKIDGWNGKD